MTPTVTHRASMTRTLTIALLAAAFSPRYVSAQSTTAICEASFSWMDNDKGQSPCLVAAFLNGQCLSIPSTSTVLPLEQIPGLTDYYAPPTAGRLVPSDCNCNTVVYSLLAACGLCQGQGFITWTRWDVNCPSVFVERFPDSIPSTVSVPQWAYLDVTASNNFNLTAALVLASENKPDVTSNSNTNSNSNSNTNSNSNSNSSPTSTSSPTSSFSSPHKKSIVGPVVGGVVGGVGGLALVALGIWFWLRRRNQRKENTPQPSTSGGVVLPPSSQGTPDIEKPGYVHSPSPLSAVNGAQVLQQEPVLAYSLQDQQYQQQQQLAQAQAQHPTVATTAPSLFSNPSTTATAIPLRPYNPNDPSTFPDALLSYSSPQHQQVTSPVTPATPISSTSLLHTQNTDTSRPFSGVPEVEGTFYVPPTQQQPQQLQTGGGGYVPASGQGLHHHSQSQSQSGGGGGGYQPTEY